MNEELKIELGVNEWLKLIKEDKNLNGAYISICQYIYLTEKENKKLEEESEKFNKIKEMFESGVVDLEELKNIVLGDDENDK